jgi:predicted TIM-barrel fold metal-dependent hydrolase
VAVTPERPTNFCQVAELAEANPTLPVIMGQLWIPYFWPAATVLAVKYPNVYLELGMTCTKMLEDALAKIGPEKVLFGSGAPVQRPFAVIQHVRGLGLSRADQDLILGGNAERLLGLDGEGGERPSLRPRAVRKGRGARPPAPSSKASRRPASSKKGLRGGRP